MTDDLERLEEAAGQLLILYPRLTEALAKDQGNTDGRSGGSVVPSIPVNPDVLDSIRDLATAIPQTDAAMRTALRFDRDEITPTRPVKDCLTYADALWRRLHAHEELKDQATDYARKMRSWLRTARLALGLATHPADIGHHCPFCDGDLQLCGDEAQLHEPDDIEAITWARGDLIYCPKCQREWPAPLWDTLGKLIEAEAERRKKAEAEAAEEDLEDDDLEQTA